MQCCFEKLSYEVIEGDRLDSNINCNRQLPYSLTVTLKYTDGSAKLSKLLVTYSLYHMYTVCTYFKNVCNDIYDGDSTDL